MQQNNYNTSRKMNNNNNNNKPVYKTFCKVCQDSGKTEKEYTSHNVRDSKSGNTTCPMLLSQECKRCFRRGHTIKYCTQQPMQQPMQPVVKKAESQAKTTPATKSKNMFTAFDTDSDEEEVVEEFPTLAAVVKPVAALNYGRLISMTEQQVKKEEIQAIVRSEQKAAAVKAPTLIVAPVVKTQKTFTSWASAESDSDGSDEEEDNSAW